MGDFERHLAHIPTTGHRSVAFLGGTIGNFAPAARAEFLAALAATLRPGETLLLGTDLVKDPGRLVRAYANGSYREISPASIGLVVAGILYFVTPLDLVPDAIPGAGLVDDVTVLAFVLARLEGELARFTAWERADAITIEEPPPRRTW